MAQRPYKIDGFILLEIIFNFISTNWIIIQKNNLHYFQLINTSNKSAISTGSKIYSSTSCFLLAGQAGHYILHYVFGCI